MTRKSFAVFMLALLLAACARSVDPATAVPDARALIASGKAGEARILLKNALAKAGAVPGARELLAAMALDEGDLQTAGDELAALDAAAAAAPQAAALRVRVALGRGNTDEAARLLDVADNAIVEPQRSVLRAQVLIARNAPVEALGVLRTAQHAHPGDERLAVDIAGTLAAMGDVGNGIAELDRYLADSQRPRAEALRARGALKLRQGSPTAAVEDFKAALAAAPPDWPVLARMQTELSIAEAQLATGDLPQLRKQLDHVDEKWPNLFATAMLRARLALLDGHASEAVDQLGGLVEKAPQDARLQYLLADALIRSGNIARATQILERRIAQQPADMPARRTLAGLWMRQGRPDKVIEVLGGSSAEAPDAGEDDLLATARTARARASGAISELRKQLDASPGDEKLRMRLAAAQIENGEPDVALATLGPIPQRGWSASTGAVRMAALLAMGNELEANRLADRLLDPATGTDTATLIAAADIARRQGRAVIAGRLLERAATLQPDEPEVHLRRASLAFEAKHHDEAEKALRELLNKHPENLDARVALARVAEAEGKADIAREALREAMALDPAALAPPLMLAALELRADHVAEANKVLDALIKAQSDGKAANAAGLLLANARHTEEARTRFRQAVDQDAGNAAYWLNLGRAQLALADRNAARESFVKSAQLQPDFLPAVAGAVRLSLEVRDVAGARKLSVALARALPDSAQAQLLDGETAMVAGEAEAASRAFARSATLKPSAAAAIGEFHARVGTRAPRADGPLLNWLAREPGDLTVRRLLAGHYLATGDKRAAREQLEAVIRRAPNDVASLNNLAWLLGEADAKRAEQLALQAWQIAPDNASVADTLGMIYLANGKKTEALELLTKAAAALPKDGDVQYHHALGLHRLGRDDEARRILSGALAAGIQFQDRAAAQRLMEELGT